MPWTYQRLIDLARVPLNDEDDTRYSDEMLLAFANQGMVQLAKRRPDIFIGRYHLVPDDALLTDTVELPAGYIQPLADYVTARAESTDDEHMNSGRAASFMQLFAMEAPQ